MGFSLFRPRATLWRIAPAVALLLSAEPRAHAWGLSTELKESWATARLVFPVARERRIRYCIRNEAPARFNDASVALQIESALRFWLEPLKAQGITGVKIERVPCSGRKFHLLVQFGEEKRWPALGSYQLSSWDDRHYYSLVKFDAGFTARIGGKSYPIVDFRGYASSLKAEEALIRRPAQAKPQSVPDFAKARNLEEGAVFWSTFPALLHELGHSFGLCDTYDATMKDQCDPALSSAEQPASVMRDANYLDLTPDDATAIRRLFENYR